MAYAPNTSQSMVEPDRHYWVPIRPGLRTALLRVLHERGRSPRDGRCCVLVSESLAIGSALLGLAGTQAALLLCKA